MISTGFALAAFHFSTFDENATSFLLNTSAQLVGIALIYVMSSLDGHYLYASSRTYTMQTANWLAVSVLSLGCFFQCLVRKDMKGGPLDPAKRRSVRINASDRQLQTA